MKKPEARLWARLQPRMKAAGLDPVRIESPLTGRGIPDLNVVTGWIELKVAAPRGGVEFQPGQAAWLDRRARRGGGAWVLVQWDGKLLLYGGLQALDLDALGCRIVVALCSIETPAPAEKYDILWSQIRRG